MATRKVRLTQYRKHGGRWQFFVVGRNLNGEPNSEQVVVAGEAVNWKSPGAKFYLDWFSEQTFYRWPMPFWPAHAKVLKTPLKSMKFQPHPLRPLDNSNLQRVASGIAWRGGNGESCRNRLPKNENAGVPESPAHWT